MIKVHVKEEYLRLQKTEQYFFFEIKSGFNSSKKNSIAERKSELNNKNNFNRKWMVTTN